MAGSAHPSGLVTNAAYEQMAAAIVEEVKKARAAIKGPSLQRAANPRPAVYLATTAY